jgi:hypothetical protein
MTLELKALIECIKIAILNKSSEKLTNLINSDTFDWIEFERKLKFHSIRPIAFYAFSKLNHKECCIPDKITEMLKHFSTIQTLNNLQYTVETIEILKKFKENKLEIIPYKGNLFIHELFENNQLREIGDIDILIRPKDFMQGVSVLKSLNYEYTSYLQIKNGISYDLAVQSMLDHQVLPELSFVKNIFNLDFHSELAPYFYPYNINIEELLDKLESKTFNGYQTLLPNSNAIFWMIVLHNGGKDCWVKLKHLIDLYMFMVKYSQATDWSLIFAEAKKYKLENLLVQGFNLLAQVFDYKLPTYIVSQCKKSKPNNAILDYWDFAKPWTSIIARFKFERIFINLQDSNFKLLSYFNNYIKFYSIPRPIEEVKRFYVFPKKYTLLNFLVKAISYFYYRKF